MSTLTEKTPVDDAPQLATPTAQPMAGPVQAAAPSSAPLTS